MSARFPGIETVIHGNGAVAEVMGHVCGGVIGYPITPSTEISELYEAFRAGVGCNVWGVGGFVLQVAARVVSKHSPNVMAGHDAVYALLLASCSSEGITGRNIGVYPTQCEFRGPKLPGIRTTRRA